MSVTDEAGGGPPMIAFAGGGTGGHLYPALAVAAELRRRRPDLSLLFFATPRPLDHEIIGAQQIEMIEQPLCPLRPQPWRWPAFLFGLRRSIRLCREKIAACRPAIVVGTGGLGSVPAMHVASSAGVATAMLNPDAIPGRANRMLAKRTDLVFAQWPETVQQFGVQSTGRRPRVLVTGCPVRSAFHEADRETGLRRFGLAQAGRTLLVTGASQGSRNINRAVCANLDLFEAQSDAWQILHLTGEADHAEVAKAYRGRPVRAVVETYTQHMADALAAADLVVSRAGASTLAEITAVGRAAILMPYPYHRDQHQLANARCLERAGAATIVPDCRDAGRNAAALRTALAELMADDAKRGMMAAASRHMGRGHAAASVADHLLAFTSVGQRRS